MEEMNTMRKKQYIVNISNHLNSIIKQAENYYRSNRFSSLKKAEGILCGLLNRLNGWNLVPVDDNDQKMSIFSQINQVDLHQHIALEIIHDNALNKLNSSLSRFPNHWSGMSYHALIVSNEKMPDNIKSFPNNSWFSYKSNVWTVSRVLSIIQNNSNVDFIGNISDYLDESVRFIAKPFKNNVPLLPSLPLHGASFLHGTRDVELKALKKLLTHKSSPLFLWGSPGIGKTELAIQLAKELSPKNGAYFLRFKKPLNNKDGVMTETILSANFSNYDSLHNDRKQAYHERIEVIRKKYCDAILIIDGFDVPEMTFDEVKKDPTYQTFVSLQKYNLQLIFTTRNTIHENGFEVRYLSEKHLIKILRDCYPDDATTDEHMLELLRIVDFNTLAVILMAQILLISNGDITPFMLTDAFLHSNLTRYNFPQIVTDQNNSYKLNTFAGHLQQLFDFTSLEKSTYCALICSAFLPEDGMSESTFLQCLPVEAQQRVQYLLEVHLLHNHDEKIYSSALIRQVCWSIPSQMYECCDLFFTSLWNSVNLREEDNNLILQKAKCFSVAADKQINRHVHYAICAASLWMLTGNKEKALHYYIQAASFQHELETTNSLILSSCYFDIANIFLALGKHRTASEYALLALNNLKKLLPPLDPDLATAYFDASTYLIKDSKYTEALDNMQSGLLIRERILPKVHPDIAHSYFQIGEVYFILKDYVSSLRYYEKALPLLKNSLPINNDLLNRIYPKIDRTKFLVERQCHIKELQEQLNTLDSQLNYGDDDHAEVYYEIATCYLDLSDYQNALDYYLEALELFSFSNIQAKRRTANTISNVYKKLNNEQKALEYEEYANADDEYFLFGFDTFLEFNNYLNNLE